MVLQVSFWHLANPSRYFEVGGAIQKLGPILHPYPYWQWSVLNSLDLLLYCFRLSYSKAAWQRRGYSVPGVWIMSCTYHGPHRGASQSGLLKMTSHNFQRNMLDIVGIGFLTAAVWRLDRAVVLAAVQRQAQTEQMRIQKGCLQWQQMVLNNSVYLWVIPHSRDVSTDWHPATLCHVETPHASPCNVQWVLLWQVDTKRAAVSELQVVEIPDRCFLAIVCYGRLPVAQGQIMKFLLLAGAHRLSFSLAQYIFATCRFLVRGSNLEKLTKDVKKVAELGSIFKRPSCFLKSKCFPLDPGQGPLPCPLPPWKLFASDYSGSMSGKSGATLQQPGHKWWFVWWIKPQNRPTCLLFWRFDGHMGICQVIACGLPTVNHHFT